MYKFCDNTKQCSCCKEIQNIEDFCKDSTRSDGLESICKTCKKKKQKKYYEKNKDKLCKQKINYAKENKEKISEYYKKYYLLNKQECVDYNKEYWKKNKDKLLIKNKEWRIECKKNGKCCSCGKLNDDDKYVLCSKCRLKASHKLKLKENRMKANIYEYNKTKNDIYYKLKKILRSRLRAALKNNYKSGSAVRDLGCTIPQFKLWLEMQFEDGMSWNNWTVDGWHIDHIKPLHMFDLTDKTQYKKACHYTNLRPLWAKDNLIRKYEEFKEC